MLDVRPEHRKSTSFAITADLAWTPS